MKYNDVQCFILCSTISVDICRFDLLSRNIGIAIGKEITSRVTDIAN